MAKALKAALSVVAKAVPCKSSIVSNVPKQTGLTSKLLSCTAVDGALAPISSRAHGTLSSVLGSTNAVSLNKLSAHTTLVNKQYSTEVDKEIAKFLEKEIEYETSRSAKELPKIPGFEIVTEGGDVTLKKVGSEEQVVVKLSVNGAVDSLVSDADPGKENEPPQMVCRPPFDVEISKGGKVIAFQCSFPAPESFDDAEEYAKGEQDAERIDDQFEIQEVAIHDGEWKDTTYAVTAATMDAELFDLLMDMLDERGINDEFIAQLVDYCTAYENKQYVEFLNKLKAVAEK